MSPAVYIRCKQLHSEAKLPLHQIFTDEDGQRIGLLAGGATGDPRPQSRALGFAFHEQRQSLMNENFKGLRVAKEAGNSDEQLLKQCIEFMRIRQHEPEILVQGLDLVHMHPAFDAPMNRVLFIECKIGPGPIAQKNEDLVERLGRIAPGSGSAGLMRLRAYACKGSESWLAG